MIVFKSSIQSFKEGFSITQRQWFRASEHFDEPVGEGTFTNLLKRPDKHELAKNYIA